MEKNIKHHLRKVNRTNIWVCRYCKCIYSALGNELTTHCPMVPVAVRMAMLVRDAKADFVSGEWVLK